MRRYSKLMKKNSEVQQKESIIDEKLHGETSENIDDDSDEEDEVSYLYNQIR
jgi:hypothetical protein